MVVLRYENNSDRLTVEIVTFLLPLWRRFVDYVAHGNTEQRRAA
jgi:hypothetical protein